MHLSASLSPQQTVDNRLTAHKGDPAATFPLFAAAAVACAKSCRSNARWCRFEGDGVPVFECPCECVYGGAAWAWWVEAEGVEVTVMEEADKEAGGGSCVAFAQRNFGG